MTYAFMECKRKTTKPTHMCCSLVHSFLHTYHVRCSLLILEGPSASCRAVLCCYRSFFVVLCIHISLHNVILDRWCRHNLAYRSFFTQIKFPLKKYYISWESISWNNSECVTDKQCIRETAVYITSTNGQKNKATAGPAPRNTYT
jgi:hypothetical protein